MILIAVDTGGTFTDVVAVDSGTGRYHAAKVPTTPRRLIDGVRAATQTALRLAGAAPADVQRFVHGTTIGTNAVLERRGATGAVLATEGFEDSLEIGRLRRTRMYDLFMDAETPVFLAPRRRRRGVPERIGADGSIVKALDEQAVRELVRSLRDVEGAEAFAVCLLFSFRNNTHERRVREIIHELDPSLSVSISSEVDPMFREYERTVVTAFDAYIRPVINRYVTELGSELEQIGIHARLQIMQSRGGVTSAELIADRPVSVLLSGPAAGVIGGRHAGSLSGEADLITIDVGGTSADISLIRSDKPLVTSDAMIDTYPLRVPMVDVTTIGAGGGSIAWVDTAGNFRVGPQSAGADPGPACYGRGGTDATVTDASIVLGYLNPASFAGGTMQLDPDAAHRAVERFAAKLGMSEVEAAGGIHRVVNSRMADAIRLVSIRRGYDPREFALVLLGGAGPVHGGRLAAELAISKMIVPAAVEHEEAITVASRVATANPVELEATFVSLERQVAARMIADHAPSDETKTRWSADGRYAGQAYTLQIPLEGPISRGSLAAYGDEFHAAHQRVYGHADRDAAIELVNARVVQSWEFPRLQFHPAGGSHRRHDAASRRVYFDELGGYTAVPVWTRESLEATTTISGPAILEQPDSTLVVYPGHRVVVETTGNLIVTCAPAGGAHAG